MPHHHMQHVQNVGPNLFVHNENIAHVMPRGAACAMTLCTHRAVRTCMQAGHPMYMWHVENLNQVRSDRRTVELRFSWEGVLNHT